MVHRARPAYSGSRQVKTQSQSYKQSQSYTQSVHPTVWQNVPVCSAWVCSYKSFCFCLFIYFSLAGMGSRRQCFKRSWRAVALRVIQQTPSTLVRGCCAWTTMFKKQNTRYKNKKNKDMYIDTSLSWQMSRHVGMGSVLLYEMETDSMCLWNLRQAFLDKDYGAPAVPESGDWVEWEGGRRLRGTGGKIGDKSYTNIFLHRQGPLTAAFDHKQLIPSPTFLGFFFFFFFLKVSKFLRCRITYHATQDKTDGHLLVI